MLPRIRKVVYFHQKRSLCAYLHTPSSDKVARYSEDHTWHHAFVLITFRERFFTAVIMSWTRGDFLRFSSSRECIVYRIVPHSEIVRFMNGAEWHDAASIHAYAFILTFFGNDNDYGTCQQSHAIIALCDRTRKESATKSLINPVRLTNIYILTIIINGQVFDMKHCLCFEIKVSVLIPIKKNFERKNGKYF